MHLRGTGAPTVCSHGGGRAAGYFTVTVLVATPPRLLRTVMFCGFTDTVNSPR